MPLLLADRSWDGTLLVAAVLPTSSSSSFSSFSQSTITPAMTLLRIVLLRWPITPTRTRTAKNSNTTAAKTTARAAQEAIIQHTLTYRSSPATPTTSSKRNSGRTPPPATSATHGGGGSDGGGGGSAFRVMKILLLQKDYVVAWIVPEEEEEQEGEMAEGGAGDTVGAAVVGNIVQPGVGGLVVVWDLVRGVVTQRFRPKDNGRILNVAKATTTTTTTTTTTGNNDNPASGTAFYVVVAVQKNKSRHSSSGSNSTKVQVHQVDAVTGQVQRKVKMGKLLPGRDDDDDDNDHDDNDGQEEEEQHSNIKGGSGSCCWGLIITPEAWVLHGPDKVRAVHPVTGMKLAKCALTTTTVAQHSIGLSAARMVLIPTPSSYHGLLVLTISAKHGGLILLDALRGKTIQKSSSPPLITLHNHKTSPEDWVHVQVVSDPPSSTTNSKVGQLPDFMGQYQIYVQDGYYSHAVYRLVLLQLPAGSTAAAAAAGGREGKTPKAVGVVTVHSVELIHQWTHEADADDADDDAGNNHSANAIFFSSAGGGGRGGGPPVLTSLEYQNGQWLLQDRLEPYHVQRSKRTAAEATDAVSNSKKRKAGTNVTHLGPTQAGREALQISEGGVAPPLQKVRSSRTTADKDLKTARGDMESKDLDQNEDDEEEDDGIDDEMDGPTVAERLKQLQQALDEEEEEAEDDDEEKRMEEGGSDMVVVAGGTTIQFAPKTATVPALTQVLVQALHSADDNLLEMVLQVKAASLIQPTVQSLADADLLQLFTALTTRLIKKPNRFAVASVRHESQTPSAGSPLTQWIVCVLQTGRVNSISHLQPLRNVIQERVEVFPELLQLEGRLSMMGGGSGGGAMSASM